MAKERAPEPSGWALARRFQDTRSARRAYEEVRDLILFDDVDASVFRFTLAGTSFVAVLGEVPLTVEEGKKVETALGEDGEPADLPGEVGSHLRDRRRQFKGLGLEYLERRSGQP